MKIFETISFSPHQKCATAFFEGIVFIMPRKTEQRTGFHLKYIPAGTLMEFEQMAMGFTHMQDKKAAVCKFFEAFSSIIERCWNSNSEFVPVSTRVLAKKLCISSSGVAGILKILIANKFLVRDKSKFKIAEHAWEYKPQYKSLDTILINRQLINKKSDCMLSGFNTENLKGDLKIYMKVLCKIRFDNKVYDYMNNICQSKVIPTIQAIYCNSSVPYCGTGNGSVPYKVLGQIPTEFIPVFKIITGRFRVSRPITTSRVYSNITNLQRGYRKFLRLNGKPLIGFDIANSQPMIAAVAFRTYSERIYAEIKPDVLLYQKDCEAGQFYEYFMNINGIDTIDDVVRTKFKGTFFGSVFYTMCVELNETCNCKSECKCSSGKQLKARLIKQFQERYPTCYDAICKIKGGLYSKEYKSFPALMTEIETFIMFETNMELIREGYDVLNIFDSLYADNDDAIARAKELCLQKFSLFEINPTLKDIRYEI